MMEASRTSKAYGGQPGQDAWSSSTVKPLEGLPWFAARTSSRAGNWTSYVRSKDGASELTAAGTFRDNNQYSVRDVDGTGSTALNYEAAYDKSGNLVDDDKPAGGRTETAYGFRYVYDGWNRLRKAFDGNGQSGSLVKEYRYNGLGHLIAEHADSDGDSDVDGSDQWRHNQHTVCTVADAHVHRKSMSRSRATDRFFFRLLVLRTIRTGRLVAVWEDSDSLPSEVYSHHHAGRGGSSYIDGAKASFGRTNRLPAPPRGARPARSAASVTRTTTRRRCLARSVCTTPCVRERSARTPEVK